MMPYLKTHTNKQTESWTSLTHRRRPRVVVLDERSQTQKSCTLNDLFSIDGQSSNAKDCLSGFWEQESEEEGRQTMWRVLRQADWLSRFTHTCNTS